MLVGFTGSNPWFSANLGKFESNRRRAVTRQFLANGISPACIVCQHGCFFRMGDLSSDCILLHWWHVPLVPSFS